MSFLVTILTKNDAFCSSGELKRLLMDCANRVGAGETEGKLRDINGNVVGDFGSRKETMQIHEIYPADFGDLMGKSPGFCREYEKR